jgi:hypothetical protein
VQSFTCIGVGEIHFGLGALIDACSDNPHYLPLGVIMMLTKVRALGDIAQRESAEVALWFVVQAETGTLRERVSSDMKVDRGAIADFLQVCTLPIHITSQPSFISVALMMDLYTEPFSSCI